jgi:hypothetical protein
MVKRVVFIACSFVFCALKKNRADPASNKRKAPHRSRLDIEPDPYSQNDSLADRLQGAALDLRPSSFLREMLSHRLSRFACTSKQKRSKSPQPRRAVQLLCLLWNRCYGRVAVSVHTHVPWAIVTSIGPQVRLRHERLKPQALAQIDFQFLIRYFFGE